MSNREDEICEAIRLLNDLNKSPEFIAGQVERTVPEVQAFLKTGTLPKRQKSLFAETIEPQKEKPESRLAPWIQALRK